MFYAHASKSFGLACTRYKESDCTRNPKGSERKLIEPSREINYSMVNLYYYLVDSIQISFMLALEVVDEWEDHLRDNGFYEGDLHSMLSKWVELILIHYLLCLCLVLGELGGEENYVNP